MLRLESRTLDRHRAIAVCCMLAACAISAKPPAIAVPSNEPGTTRPATDQLIPATQLQDMYRRELGDLFRPAQFEALHAAHRLIEQYFQSPSAGQRKAIVAQLEATRIDSNLLGRLTRLHLDWPAMPGGGVFYINQRVGPYDVRYFLGVPKSYDRGRPWPLVIKLPGAAAFLTDPPPDARRVVQIYTAWIQDELKAHGDAIVLMPLLDLDEVYGPSYGGMNSVIQPLLDAPNHVNVDPARIYMAGHSMAAHAVWNLVLHYPSYFAAVDALAGQATADWQKLRLMNLRNVLPVAWIDQDDKVVKPIQVEAMVRTLRNLKVEVNFEETRGMGHVPPPELAENEYKQMRQRTRNLYPPQVWLQSNRPDVMFNRSDWVQIYQPEDPGKEHRLYFHHGTGHMTVDSNSWSIKAQLQNNQITVAADNVDSLRFYLNDQMIDFSKPVTVTVNRKVKFQGLVKPSIDEMLKDQLFLGRGWRYFTGVIDLELVNRPTPAPTTRPTTRKGRIIVGPSPD